MNYLITIYCAFCGRLYSAKLTQGWIESGSKTRVCSEECHDKMNKLYTLGLLSKTEDIISVENIDKIWEERKNVKCTE